MIARWGWAGLCLSVFALGCFGFLQQDPNLPLGEAIYRGIQLFAAEFPDGVAGEPLPPTLRIARFAAPLVLIATVVDLFSRFLTLGLRRILQLAQAKRRVVLLGFGSVGHALARALQGTGTLITAVDSHFDEADRVLAEDLGLLLIEGDLADRRVHDLARIGKAKAVYVACGTDDVNIEVGALAGSVITEFGARVSGPGMTRQTAIVSKLQVHVSSTRLAADLGDAVDLGFVRGSAFQVFSLKTAAAWDLLATLRLTQKAGDLGQRRVHLVLCGVGDYGEALLLETLLTSFADGLAAPIVTVLDCDERFAAARMQACYPRLFDASLPEEARPDVRFVAADLRSLDMERAACLDALDQDVDPPTAYVFCCGDDLVNLSAALRLETAMQRMQRRPVPVFARQWDQIVGPGDLAPEDRLSVLRTFGNARITAGRYLADHSLHLELAQKLHASYLGKVETRRETQGAAAQMAMTAAWAKLPAHAQRSNLRAVRHGTVQLASLGLQWRGMDQGRLPRISAELKAQLMQAMDQAGQSDAASGIVVSGKAEHARWMVDKAIEGMRQDPRSPDDPRQAIRDNQRGWHIDMVPYDALASDTQALDLSLLSVLITHCADPEATGAATHLRHIEDLDVDGPVPMGSTLHAATELRVTIRPSGAAIPADHWANFARAILQWADQHKACRLHVRLAPQHRFLTHRHGEKPEPLRPSLNDMTRKVAERGIVVDVSYLPDLAPAADTDDTTSLAAR